MFAAKLKLRRNRIAGTGQVPVYPPAKSFEASQQAATEFLSFMETQNVQLRKLIEKPIPLPELTAVSQQVVAMDKPVQQKYTALLSRDYPITRDMQMRASTLKRAWDKAVAYVQGGLGVVQGKPPDPSLLQDALEQLKSLAAGAAIGGGALLFGLITLYLITRN